MMNLKNARKEKGLTQKELGSLVGCSDAAISQYESGMRSPDYEMLLRLSEALDCSVDYIVRGGSESGISTAERLTVLRDCDRALLEVTRDMRPEDVDKMAEFIRGMKGQKYDY